MWLHKRNGRKLHKVYRKPKVTTCTDRAGLGGKIVGIASGLSFRLKTVKRAQSKQLILKSHRLCIQSNKHRNTPNTDGDFDVLQTAWIQARRNLLSFGKTWKLILVSFLFSAMHELYVRFFPLLKWNICVLMVTRLGMSRLFKLVYRKTILTMLGGCNS